MGGTHVSIPYEGASVFLNGEPLGETGILDHEFYIGNLAPSAYVLEVKKPEYKTWTRVVVVDPQVVTSVQALLIKEKPQLTVLTEDEIRIVREVLTRQAQDSQAAIIKNAKNSPVADMPTDVSDDLGLFLEHGDVFVRFIDDKPLPAIFCGRPSFCNSEISIENGSNVSVGAFFYRGGVVYITKEGGVYFSEIDNRPVPVNALLFSALNADAFVADEDLMIKSGGAFYKAEVVE